VKHFTCSEAKHQVWKGYNNRKKTPYLFDCCVGYSVCEDILSSESCYLVSIDADLLKNCPPPFFPNVPQCVDDHLQMILPVSRPLI
jgi:hypothetical protein